MPAATVAVLVDLPPGHRYREATLSAVADAAGALAHDVAVVAVNTDAIVGRAADELGAAVVVGPGSPYRDQEAVHAVVRSARERGVPLVGT